MAPDLVGDWWQPFTQFDDVAVVHVDLVPNEANEQSAWKWLDSGERVRARRFQHAGAGRRYVLCRASLRALLCNTLDCRNEHLSFGASEHGKPYATVEGHQAPFGFNVSHGGKQGLIALASRGRVGVDVEERVPQRNLDLLIETVLSSHERAAVAAATGPAKLHLFLDLWTMKEALSKAQGTGLSLDVSGLEVPASMRNGSRNGSLRFPDTADVEWRLANIGTNEFAAAVAYARDRR